MNFATKEYAMFVDTLKVSPNQQFAQKDAIIYDDGRGKSEKITYQQFWENIGQVAESLRRAGVRKGDRVILLSENHLRWHPIFLGIAGIGLPFLSMAIWPLKDFMQSLKIVSRSRFLFPVNLKHGLLSLCLPIARLLQLCI